jgi:hypothetical protein
MPIYVPGKLVLKKESVPFDYDAWQYIAAVEAADGEILEQPVRDAITNFVKGCKSDGIWDAIKASCVMMGARTLAGALVPLKGTAPTNYNFVSGDYDRKTGLVGDGSTKYLGSNRNNNTDPQDNFHFSIFASTGSSGTAVYAGVGAGTTEAGASNMGRSGITTFFRNRSATGLGPVTPALPVGFVGSSRSASTVALLRVAGVTNTLSSYTSQSPRNELISIFASGTSATFKADARLSFYSIGESIALDLLDARVTALSTAIGAAIP